MTASVAQQLLNSLTERQPAMLEFLQRLVFAESPSTVPHSQAGVQRLLSEALETIGYETEVLPGQQSGGHLYGRKAGAAADEPQQLLLGHSDTVWPLGTVQQMPVVVEAGRMTGPGVFDMKAGLTQMIFALRALHELGLEPPVAPLVFVNSDEEIGSKESQPHIVRLARAVQRVFVLEPSLGENGRLKTARKGVGYYQIGVRGRAAHAGLDPQKGRSAILELSHVIQKLFALNAPQRGITVNVGTVKGGTRANVIAAQASAEVDVRVPTQEAAEEVAAAIEELQAETPGVTLEISGGINRRPLEPTPRNRTLWHLARQYGAELGLELQEGMAGGGSDGNITSQYAATLDGLGAVGDGAHATHEFVYVDRMPQRAALLALLLLAAPLSAES